MRHVSTDSDHFVIGDGTLACVVEWNHTPDRPPYGLLLGTPGHLARREATLLWHPEHLLRRTMLSVLVDGVRHSAPHDSATVAWSDDGDHVVIEWRAGDADVSERLRITDGALVRDVHVTLEHATEVRIQAAFYANPILFDGFAASGNMLEASGAHVLRLRCAQATASTFERFITVAGGDATLAYELDAAQPHGERAESSTGSFAIAGRQADRSPANPHQSAPGRSTRESSATHAASELPTVGGIAPRARQLLALARHGLRAATSRDGRFNASLFQYEFEWGLDAAMVAAAACVAGDHELAREVLTNILTRLSNDEGMIVEAGRFRGGEMSELNGNGAVLDALWKYWLYSRDEALVAKHWDRVVAIAEYPLRDEFRHECGMLRTRRDFWERYPWQGVGDGFELGHQVLCCVGLRSASELAEILGDRACTRRWRDASRGIHAAMLEHPTHRLVDDGRFIRRRRVDGTVEHELVADASWRREEYAGYMPTALDATPRACEPDVTEVLPITYGLVEPHSQTAHATLAAIEALWSPAGNGGYARYNIDSDPDSPGAWPFATAMVAAAELDAGMTQRAHRTIEWLHDVAGAGGSWLEYYGPRESPPHPPVGIIVWGWAQYVLLAIEHMAGVTVERDRVLIRPRIAGPMHTLCIGAHTIDLRIDGLTTATLDGEAAELEIEIPLPLTADHDVNYR